MEKKTIREQIEEALKELESVDYTSRSKQRLNNKKVHNAYDILFDLNQKLEEE